jgi:hypothetical protein
VLRIASGRTGRPKWPNLNQVSRKLTALSNLNVDRTLESAVNKGHRFRSAPSLKSCQPKGGDLKPEATIITKNATNSNYSSAD